MNKFYLPGNVRLLWLALYFAALLHPGLSWAQDAHSFPECYWRPADSTGLSARPANTPGNPGPGGPMQIATGTISCGAPEEAAPGYYVNQLQIPNMPVKTVRLVIHVLQKDDGTENWQSPAQDGGAQEAVLRGIVTGLGNWAGGPVPGVNGIYRKLDNRLTTPTGGWTTPVTTAPAPLQDTRIQFQVAQVRYYRDTYAWNMSEGSTLTCPGGGTAGNCTSYLYDKYVVNTVANPGQQNAIPNDLVDNAIHVFTGEHPGVGTPNLDAYGVPVNRYRMGGVAMGTRCIILRGYYWNLYNHPLMAPNTAFNPDDPSNPNNVANQQASFRVLQWNLSHELGHCLGLGHAWGTGATCSFSGPGNGQQESNNIMDYPLLPGYSLSQCQIGIMHNRLNAGEVMPPGVGYATYQFRTDAAQVRDHCQPLAGQDTYVSSSQTWRTVHNMRGNLHVKSGATLIVSCRLGFAGPTAKIIVHKGGRLILRGADIGTYRTSDAYECPNGLQLYLGGTPATTPADADNAGLIQIEDPANRILSNNPGALKVKLASGATLHIRSNADVLFEQGVLETMPGSYLCIEPGASLRYAGSGTLAISSATNLGISPDVTANITLNPTPTCQGNLCDIQSQALQLTSSATGDPLNEICSGDAVTLTLRGLANTAYTYQWYRDGSLLAGATSSTLTESLTNTIVSTMGASVQEYNYTCKVTPPGCPSVNRSIRIRVRPLVDMVVNTPTPVVCLVGSGPEYATDADGVPYYILKENVANIDLAASIAQASTINGNAVGGTTNFAWSGSPYLDHNTFIAGHGPGTKLRLDALQQQGAQQITLTLCAWLTSFQGIPGTPSYGNSRDRTTCQVCREVTLYFSNGSDFTVKAEESSICAGESTVLHAGGASSNTFTWEPGNLTGSSVVVTPDVTTEYTVTATNGSGCQSQRKVTVKVRPATCGDCVKSSQLIIMEKGDYHGDLEFKSGYTYHFPIDTYFHNGLFDVQPGATLTFDKGVYLIIGDDGFLNVHQGTLTASCEAMWGGILIKSWYGMQAAHSEISHAIDGIVLAFDPSAAPANSGAPYGLSLTDTRFLNNLQSVMLKEGAGATPGIINIVGCTFDSDPHQMRAPYHYRTPTKQFCSWRHLNLNGDLSYLQFSHNTLKHALFGVWMPEGQGLNSSKNVFSDCYVAAAYNYVNKRPSTWTDNVITFPVPDNAFSHLPLDFVRDALVEVTALEGPLGPVQPSTCFGIYAQGDPLVVERCRFEQTQQPFTLYRYAVPYPQTGLFARPGTTLVRNNHFEQLYQGYLAPAEQADGEVLGNTFLGCQIGLRFQRQDATLPTGTAVVDCNSFMRPAGVGGESFGIWRAPGIFTAPGQPLEQLDFSFEPSGAPGIPGTILRLQRNAFTGNNSGNNNAATGSTYWHVYNSSGNPPLNYARYEQAATAVPNDAEDDHLGPDNQVQGAYTGATFNSSVTCLTTLGYTTGLQRAAATLSTSRATVPGTYLTQNVPNPCTGTTTISYRTTAPARLLVRDVSGRLCRTEPLAAGEHTLTLDLRTLPAGLYIYTLEVAGRSLAHHKLLIQ
ncbi:T9SS type A sorting domain-containing protein [Hymenobacter sp. ASUV-10]|uniref:T9SS type A sorting domain-containing protein n=1 Tax=Hymenobacter aranciens TaxID=3063996 RepID=A0ABT9BHZ8_9BACT|nr:T9SS type A sorting domain-containing protein [Hymenobacter sp. ASUV-10]MDO7877298.1 T9SS type A sorting domain-containing protein [Hymenobacter sp. ASUV-10]